MARLDDLKAKLAARTDQATGKPMNGYRQNCLALQAEISRLETASAAPGAESTGSVLDKLTADAEALAGYPVAPA